MNKRQEQKMEKMINKVGSILGGYFAILIIACIFSLALMTFTGLTIANNFPIIAYIFLQAVLIVLFSLVLQPYINKLIYYLQA